MFLSEWASNSAKSYWAGLLWASGLEPLGSRPHVGQVCPLHTGSFASSSARGAPAQHPLVSWSECHFL